MMSSRDYIIARYEVQGKRFEIIVDPRLAFEYRETGKPNINEVLKGEFVYKDARKGLKASPEDLKKVFGTTEIEKVAETILRKGELQLTTEQRRRMLEQKRKLIINYISRNAIDPKTKVPIPPTRIEKAMEEARVGIDLYKPIEEQAMAIVKAISRYIPLKIARAYMQVTIPPAYSGRAYQQAMHLGNVKKTEWRNDGSLYLELEIPAGLQNEVIDKLNKLTRGEVSVKVLNIE
jgi:ribosome maturation protein SDO1